MNLTMSSVKATAYKTKDTNSYEYLGPLDTNITQLEFDTKESESVWIILESDKEALGGTFQAQVNSESIINDNEGEKNRGPRGDSTFGIVFIIMGVIFSIIFFLAIFRIVYYFYLRARYHADLERRDQQAMLTNRVDYSNPQYMHQSNRYFTQNQNEPPQEGFQPPGRFVQQTYQQPVSQPSHQPTQQPYLQPAPQPYQNPMHVPTQKPVQQPLMQQPPMQPSPAKDHAQPSHPEEFEV